MKVLVITNMYSSPQTPTAGVFIEQQVAGLEKMGLSTQVLYFNRHQEGVGIYYRMEKAVRSQMKTLRPDLIHVMYGGVMAHEITRRDWGVPVIVTFHGSDLLGENLSGWARKAISYYGVWCSHRAARKAQGIVTVSRVLEQALPASIDRAKLRIIPCGIDLQRFAPLDPAECRSRLGWNEREFHILFPVNAGNPVKQPELAKAAVAALRTQGVKAQLHFMQGVPNSEVPQWLNASHALLLTSKHEGSPTVVKEALACNVPVVSVRVGDVEERLEGIKGCYLADATPKALAEALVKVSKGAPRVDSRKQMETIAHTAIALDLKNFYEETLRRECAPRDE